MKSTTIFVGGTPIPQGSLTIYGRGQYAHTQPGLAAWRDRVRYCTLDALRRNGWTLPYDGPVAVSVTFHLPRPKSVKRPWPSVKPDLDKLQRAIGDALAPRTGPKILTEDSRIIEWHSYKRYAEGEPGVLITISQLD
ncbi:RusA family crossover junction endodeoxyribonuclease [Bowdeniella massiliensis]|uniref:RusA family crossover junction endodeoxyribonuclease n=1 Tax=Bowdeniella massiliensis TaxID=2932264 RepID=UPI0020278B91